MRAYFSTMRTLLRRVASLEAVAWMHANVAVALGFLFPGFDCRVLSTLVRPVRPFTVEAFGTTVLIVR